MSLRTMQLPKPHNQYNPEPRAEEILKELAYKLYAYDVGSPTHKAVTEAARSAEGYRVSFDVDPRFHEHGAMLVLNKLLEAFWSGSHYLVEPKSNKLTLVIKCPRRPEDV